MVTISGYLTGRIIVDFPQSESHDFQKSVIFICKHDENGAMGFVINQPLYKVSLSHLMDPGSFHNLHDGQNMFSDPCIFWGGSVEMNRGFVLHSLEKKMSDTILVNKSYGVTANLEILQSIINKKNAPKYFKVFLGYLAWQAGELEKEIADDSWVGLPCSAEFLFEAPAEEKWNMVMDELGLPSHIACVRHGSA